MCILCSGSFFALWIILSLHSLLQVLVKVMATRKDILMFSVPELCEWLYEELKDDVREDCIQALRSNWVNGRTFLDSTEDDLKELCPLLGERKAVYRIVEKLRPEICSVRFAY